MMKQGIHPKYMECKVTCACGNEFITESTKEDIRLDVCSACHPFFTGQQKFINRGGRVEKFKKSSTLIKTKEPEIHFRFLKRYVDRS